MIQVPEFRQGLRSQGDSGTNDFKLSEVTTAEIPEVLERYLANG